MTKNAITWIREDFRIENNPALSYATQNHEMYLPYTFITKMIMTIKERLKNGGFQNLLKHLDPNYLNTKSIFRY